MFIPFCPHKDGKDWKKMLKHYDEDTAYILWNKNGGNPVHLDEEGNPNPIFEQFKKAYGEDEAYSLIEMTFEDKEIPNWEEPAKYVVPPKEAVKEEGKGEPKEDTSDKETIIRNKGIYDLVSHILPEDQFGEWKKDTEANKGKNLRSAELLQSIEKTNNQSYRNETEKLISQINNGKSEINLTNVADILSELGKLRQEREQIINDQLSAIEKGADTKELRKYDDLKADKDRKLVNAADAATKVGTLASNMLGIRSELNFESPRYDIVQLQKEYAAGKHMSVKDLSDDQLKEIGDHYERLKQLNKDLESEKKAKTENIEKEALVKQVKDLYDQLQQAIKSKKITSQERVASYKKKIESGRNELKKLAYGQLSSMGILNPKIYTALGKIASGHIEQFYEEAKSKIEIGKLIKDTLKSAQEIMPEITEQDVKDAISGNYKRPVLKKTEVQVIKNDIKKEIKAANKYKNELLKEDLDDTIGELEKKLSKTKTGNENYDNIKKQLDKLKELRKGKYPEKKIAKEDIPIVERLKEEQKNAREKNKEQFKVETWHKEKLKRLYQSLIDIKEKNKNGEYASQEQEWRNYIPTQKELQIQRLIDNERTKWKIDRNRDLHENEPWILKRASDWVDVIRGNNLMFMGTFAKLAANVVGNITTLAPRVAIQNIVHGSLRGLSYVATKGKDSRLLTRNAGEWGYVDLKTLGAFYVDVFKSFGNAKNYILDRWANAEKKGALGWSRYGEISHGTIKETIRSPYTNMALKMNTKEALANWNEAEAKLKSKNLTAKEKEAWTRQSELSNLNNQNNLYRIDQQAHDFGKYNIYLNNNAFAKKIKNLFGYPTTTMGKLADRLLWKSAVTIVSVPANYVSRFIYNRAGAIFKTFGTEIGKDRSPGLPEAILGTLKRGDYLNDFTPEQRKGLSKNIANASVSAVLLLAGYALKNSITYDDKKREYNIDGHPVAEKLLHYHVAEITLSNALMFQAMDEAGGDIHKYIWDYIESDAKQLKNMPFYSQMTYSYLGTALDIANDLNNIKDERKKKIVEDLAIKVVGQYGGMMLAPPGFVREIAKWSDERVAKGATIYPHDLEDYVKINWPWLHEGIKSSEAIAVDKAKGGVVHTTPEQKKATQATSAAKDQHIKDVTGESPKEIRAGQKTGSSLKGNNFNSGALKGDGWSNKKGL